MAVKNENGGNDTIDNLKNKIDDLEKKHTESKNAPEEEYAVAEILDDDLLTFAIMFNNITSKTCLSEYDMNSRFFLDGLFNCANKGVVFRIILFIMSTEKVLYLI